MGGLFSWFSPKQPSSDPQQYLGDDQAPYLTEGGRRRKAAKGGRKTSKAGRRRSRAAKRRP